MRDRMRGLGAAGTAILVLVAVAASRAEEPRPAAPAPLPHAAVQAVGPSSKQPLPRWVSTKGETFLRRGPGREHRVDWVLRHRGTPLLVVAEYEHWRRVVDADGTMGWVHYARLDRARTVLVTRAPEALLRAAPAEGAEIVARAEQGVIGRLHRCARDWCEIEAGGIEGWAAKTDLWGVGPEEAFE